MKQTLLCLALVLLTGACTQQPHRNGNYTEVQLPLNNRENRLNLSEVADSIHYIALETHDECLIGAVDKILLTDSGRLLIVDKDVSSSLFLYDSDGRFLRTLGKRGAGQGEYAVIEDVACFRNFVYIWDSRAKRVLKFTEDGDFLESFAFDYHAYSFCCLDEDKLAFCCDYTPNPRLYAPHQYPSLLFFDPKRDEVKPALFFDADISSRAYISILNNLCNNDLRLPLNDTIYHVTSSGIEKKRVLQYAERYRKNKNAYIERSKTEPLSADDADRSFAEEMFPHLITYLGCEEVDIFFMRMRDFIYYGFYYPKSGIYKECSSGKSIPVANDIDGIALFTPYCSRGNVVYSIAAPSQVLEGKPSGRVLKGDITGLTEDSNPVIVQIFMKR